MFYLNIILNITVVARKITFYMPVFIFLLTLQCLKDIAIHRKVYGFFSSTIDRLIKHVNLYCSISFYVRKIDFRTQ